MSAPTSDSPPKRPSVLLGTAHIAALWALAIVQPMLSLLGENPEFFVARSNTFSQILLFAVVLTFGPPLLALAVEALAERIGPALRWKVHLVFLSIVTSVLVLGLLNDYLDLPFMVLAASTLLLAIGATVAYGRYRFPRSFLDMLTPAPIVILVLFIFFSPASRVILPGSEPTPIELEIGKPSPVVMIIFDEFPLATLLESESRVDASRYPNFAEMASQSTWYRNASAAAAYTPFAVPAILSGRNANLDKVPTSTDYRESIFTLLGDSYDLRTDERLTRICPDSLCPENSEASDYDSGTGALFSDLSVVLGHLTLPESIRDALPDISSTFGGFGTSRSEDEVQTEAGGATVEARGDGGRAAEIANVFGGDNRRSVEAQVAAFGAGIDPGADRFLEVIHLLKPHIPWKHIPSGQRYSNLNDEWMDLSPEFRRWEAPQTIVDSALQRGLLEVGYADTLFGRLKGVLEDRGLWSEALVVVTADHGAGYRAGDERRRATPTNLGEVASVPLFIKAPGQNAPSRVDRHTCLSSILPRIATILEIDYPWTVDQCSRDEVRVAGPPSDLMVGKVTTMEEQRNRLLDRIRRLFTTGTGWGPVYRSGPRKSLIGRPVRSFDAVKPERGRIANPEAPGSLEDFDPDRALLRGLLQRGSVKGVEEHAVVAIALNERIEGVGWVFDDGNRDALGYSILLDPKAPRIGFNELDIYLVRDGGRSLQPLFKGGRG